MYKNFEKYMLGVLSFYNSWENMVIELTNKLVNLRNRPNSTEIIQIQQNKIIPGKFYLIQYDFNGNLIWCPILSLDYKINKNKHILYAVNLEYLPPKYKVIFFNKIFKYAADNMIKISEKQFVRDEPPLKFLTFDFVYKMLKNNGNMHYAITAYTIKDFNDKFKIKKCFTCSIKILPEIIMSDFKKFNAKSMKDMQKTLIGEPNVKLTDIIEQYDKIIEQYDADSIEYHKKLALFREKLKLYNDQ